jgi:hypothetical protein
MEKITGRLTQKLSDAKEWALKNIAGKKVFHNDINDEIVFTASGLTHGIYAKTYPEKIEIIYNIIELTSNSNLYAIEKDKKNRPDIKAIYKFVSQWNYKEKDYFVYIVVRENKTGKFYYDHGIIKQKP